MAAARTEGELTSWNDERGFGFVTPDGGGRRVFVHISAFPRVAARPRVGARLRYRVATSAQGKPEAVDVEVTRAGTASRTTAPRPPREARPSASARPSPSRIDSGEYRRNRGAQSLVSYAVILAFAVLYLVVSLYWRVPVQVAAVYAVASVVSFVVYATDKAAARVGRWRTSESTLLAFAVVGGWPGAIVAQQVLRHKTRKRSFQTAFYGCVALNVVAFIVFTSPPVSGLFG